MMSEKENFTDYWLCNCNKKNRLFIHRCPNCNAVISNEILNAVYKEEINKQNNVYEKEEKRRRTLILSVGLLLLLLLLMNFGLVMFFIGLLFLFLFFLFGLFAGAFYIWPIIRCVFGEKDYPNDVIKTRVAGNRICIGIIDF